MDPRDQDLTVATLDEEIAKHEEHVRSRGDPNHVVDRPHWVLRSGTVTLDHGEFLDDLENGR